MFVSELWERKQAFDFDFKLFPQLLYFILVDDSSDSSCTIEISSILSDEPSRDYTPKRKRDIKAYAKETIEKDAALRKKCRRWTADEEERFRLAVKQSSNWKEVVEAVATKTYQ